MNYFTLRIINMLMETIKDLYISVRTDSDCHPLAGSRIWVPFSSAAGKAGERSKIEKRGASLTYAAPLSQGPASGVNARMFGTFYR